MNAELFPKPTGIAFDEFYAVLQREGKCGYVHFNKKRARIFHALLKSKNRPLTPDQAWEAAYYDIPECDQPECKTIVPVMICQIRKMIRPFDLDIVHLRDSGWCLVDRKAHGQQVRSQAG